MRPLHKGARGTLQDMKPHNISDELDFDFDELPRTVSAHIEHLSRKWAEEQVRQERHHRQTLTRRRIEDWREERERRRQFDDDLEVD